MKAEMTRRTLAAALLAASASALAGGPLYLQAPGQPFAYAGPVEVYTDLTELGPWSNDTADAAVEFAWNEWSSVPTSSFSASVAGDFADIGLPPIDGSNAQLVIGAYNGGGIHVIYDHDGSVLRDVLGAPYGVLGVASPDVAAADGSGEILESWAVINGSAIPDADPATVAGYTGVMTHEFGHSINLAHTQTNGAVLFFGDNVAPTGCDDSAYMGPGLAVNDIETMYPFISPTQTGQAVSTVDTLDDRAALSNLYPAAGWPGSHGAIEGVIRRGGGDNRQQITGVNVIARNVADPFADATSALSGDYSQGAAGADGQYRFTGLTPGADYVVYVDDIAQGGFSTPPAFLPGPEEYYNGRDESANAETDHVCEATPLTAQAGSTARADIAFNHVPGAPVMAMTDYPGLVVSSLTHDGGKGVGLVIGLEVGFVWDQKKELLEPFATPLFPVISGNGKHIAGTGVGADGLGRAGFWLGNASDSESIWSAIDELPGTEGCDWLGSRSSAWGISRDGDYLTGQNVTNCNTIEGFVWSAADGMVALPFTDRPEGTYYQARGNDVSADGRVVVGFDTWTFGRAATVWTDGVPEWQSLVQEVRFTDWQGNEIVENWPVGEALAVSDDGRTVVGDGAWNEFGMAGVPWMWTAEGGLELIEGIPCIDRTVFQFKCWSGVPESGTASGVSADGGVVVGRVAWSFFDPADGFIWTRELGAMELQQFLEIQNVLAVDGWKNLIAATVSGDGRTIGGWGTVPVPGDPFGFQSEAWGFRITIDKVDVCHNPDSRKPVTLQVAFPESMDSHLAHGDTFGACED